MAGRKKRKRGAGTRVPLGPSYLRTFQPQNSVRLVASNDGPTPAFDPMCDYIADGAQWWACRSTRSRRELQKAFDQQEVATVLYERTGAIIELGREGNFYLLAIQLVRINRGDKDWDIDLCLAEIGVYVDELCEEE